MNPAMSSSSLKRIARRSLRRMAPGESHAIATLHFQERLVIRVVTFGTAAFDVQRLAMGRSVFVQVFLCQQQSADCQYEHR